MQKPTNTPAYIVSSASFDELTPIHMFVEDAWKKRGNLNPLQKRGLNSIIFILFCAQIESMLYQSLRLGIDALEMNQHHLRGNVKAASMVIRHHSKWWRKECKNAPIFKLKELFLTFYDKSLKDVIGNENHQALEAISDMRNTLAHGRTIDIDIEFDLQSANDSVINLDKLAVKKVLDFLKLKKAIQTTQMTGATYHAQLQAVFGDLTITLFYQSLNQIKERLIEFLKEFGLKPEKSDFKEFIKL